MNKQENKFKIKIAYQSHTVTVDLRRIVAISKPREDDKFFKVFFENAIWAMSPDQYERLYNAWMTV